jgi:hypothetical protein
MLLDRKETDIVILGPKEHDPRYVVPGAELVPTTGEPDCFWEMFKLFRATTLLGGDVYYTDKSMDAAVKIPEDFNFVGRRKPSRFSGQKHPEIWSISMILNCKPMIEKILRAHQSVRPCPTAWDVYNTLRLSKGGHWTEIDDRTIDFDTPYDYVGWNKCLPM